MLISKSALTLAPSLLLFASLSLAPGCSGSQLQGNMDPGTFMPVTVPGCTGTCGIRTDCPTDQGPTTLTGVVNIPAGNLPLYNARVYIPSGDMPAAPVSGASCDRCDSVPPAAAFTTTGIDGTFTLTDVPVGENIPLIISVGKWRRVVTLPPITACTKTALDVSQTRLPRNQSEGNIPKIALTTGGADAMECLLRSSKLGLDDSEFTLPTGSGRVNFYSGSGNPGPATTRYQAGFNGSTAAVSLPTANPWWDQLSNLQKNDILILSCEGAQFDNTKSASAKTALQGYLDKGGRVFASHWHNDWLQNGTTALKSVATFTAYNGPDPSTETIDTSPGFTKGQALADWMMLPSVMGSTVRGQLTVNGARYTLNTIAPKITQRWVYYQPQTGPALPQYFSFNAPVGADSTLQCGQMVFTDLHVTSGGTGNVDSGGPDFPGGCQAGALSAQEKALIFMLFDLTNCLAPPIG